MAVQIWRQVENLDREHEMQNPLENLFVECPPISNAAVQAPDVDEIETFFLVYPLIAAVVHLEL